VPFAPLPSISLFGAADEGSRERAILPCLDTQPITLKGQAYPELAPQVGDFLDWWCSSKLKNDSGRQPCIFVDNIESSYQALGC
jgi:hypothetical protein